MELPCTDTPELRAAVVGAGSIGSLHALKYTAIPGIALRYVVDIEPERASRVAALHGAEPLQDYRELAGRVDIASVATPTVTHHRIASDLIAAGVALLVEKPMAATLEEAHDLAALALGNETVLQIGHLERFNPAVVELRSLLSSPRFIECHRLAPFSQRGTDVDVVLDLMSHDLDVILALTGSQIRSVEAIGVAVLTEQVDVANARLRFADGLIANLNTSRVAARRERKIRFFQPDAYISVDYQARRIQLYRKEAPMPGASYPVISGQTIDFGAGDPLRDEIATFIASVRTGQPPAVGAADGLRVMEACELIKSAMLREEPVSRPAPD